MGEKKKIILITGTEDTRVSLLKQIQEFVEPFATVEGYAVDISLPSFITGDLIILSSSLLLSEVAGIIDASKPLVITRRMINYDYVDKILMIPKGKKALLVNDVPETAFETIDYLNRLGIDHIEYIPFYPGAETSDDYDIAITPGEPHLVPVGVRTVINIGPRLIDMTSIMEIFRKLEILDERADALSEKYIIKIIQLAKKLAQFTNEKTALNEELTLVLNSINDALMVVDPTGMIQMINDNMEAILNVSKKKAQGRDIRYYIQESPLLDFILENSEAKEKSKYCTFRGQEVIVQKFVLKEKKSTVISLKNIHETLEMDRKLKRELINKGYVAKYNFEDVVGNSKLLQHTKEIAKKLAAVDYTILIEGESGTGKELFASAIHNLSLRREGPFLAVNFSALPEELVESELFGYEEGAFTGAKKGGKIGLFEQANGGTIFLDEIGDISPKIQTRLLRVLQEREIMRLGGNRIIPIDVRIIAATNKNLLKEIEEGKFREDLYHRLKVLYLYIPPLRERKEDITELLQHFLKEEGKQQVSVEDLVIEELKNYNWYGNVREFRNTISYMIVVSSDEIIGLESLPDRNFFQKPKGQEGHKGICQELTALERQGSLQEFIAILEEIDAACRRGKNIGRYQLYKLLIGRNIALTEQQIRHRLDILEVEGFIFKNKGPGGSKISTKGRGLLEASVKGF